MISLDTAAYAIVATALAVTSTALATTAFILAYVVRQIRAWRTWGEGPPDA